MRVHPTIVLLHGLEGSSDSGYMRGCAEIAFAAGFNVVRLNQRNCGGTEHLTPTLYHSGRSADLRAVLAELIARDGLREIFFAGWSMGGNLVLKMAGELGGDTPTELRGIVAVNPCFDLAACVEALGQTQNSVYSRHFVRKLKGRMRRKARMFGGIYSLDRLARRSYGLGFRRADHGAALRIRGGGRLLRAVERDAGARRDPSAGDDLDGAGRSVRAVFDVFVWRDHGELVHSAGGAGAWRTLRIYFGRSEERILVGGASGGVLQGAVGGGEDQR